MSKAILMLLLAVVSSGAMAEWVRIFETDNQNVYVNTDKILRSGNNVKIWDMNDYKKPEYANGKKVMSSGGASQIPTTHPQ